jgi:hypothetical protein
MIPFGTHTVTLLHYDGKKYVRKVLSGCSWRSTNERVLSDASTAIVERTTCRIPPQYTCPVPGDLMILGKVNATANNEIALVRLMEAMRDQGKKAFRVQSVSDNSTTGIIPHFSATGA